MKITIIGGGWLGLPLAMTLTQNGHHVVATKRTEQGVLALQQQHVQAQQFELGQDLGTPHIKSLLSCDVLIINVPPGRKTLQPDIFSRDMQALILQAKAMGSKALLFISTTAVYGSESRTVYEYSKLDPHTDSAKVHVKIEQCVQKTFQDDGCVLRLAGLVSQDRHPARFLSGKESIDQGQQVVNLIHREDVIKAVTAIVEQQHFGHTFHLSATAHPSREEYYTAAAQTLGLPPPSFNKPNSQEKGKQINCDLTLNTLSISLQYPSPYDMVQ